MLRLKYSGRSMIPGRARISAGRRVCRKYRREYIRKLQRREYEKLLRMVPALMEEQRAPPPGRRKNNRISKVKVIEETIRYIDELHKALAVRINENGPEIENDVGIKTDNNESLIQAVHASFLDQITVPVTTARETKLSKDSSESSRETNLSTDSVPVVT